MNYLAHLFLAQRTEHSLLGNLMGDFVRDINLNDLPEAAVLGVHNHKLVDRFTDSHVVILELKPLFSDKRRRFAGIIIDVLFDYFLIKHWSSFSNEDLDRFIAYCYRSLASQRHLMPQRMRHKVEWMLQADLLRSYARLDGVNKALNGISSRIRFDNQLAGAVEEIEQHYIELEYAFVPFFSELCAHIANTAIENPITRNGKVRRLG